MAEHFEQVHNALVDWAANTHSDAGMHDGYHSTIGTNGRIIGDIPYDITRHMPNQVNPYSFLGNVLDRQRVANVIRPRPLHVNVIADIAARRNYPAVNRTVNKVNEDLLGTIGDALPDMSDRMFSYVVAESDSETASSLAFDPTELLPVEEGYETVTSEIEDLALNGLTFVISDFSRIKFSNHGAENIVAIKVNHPLQRRIPSGIGVVSLYGGEGEIDTGNKRKLARENADLEARHQQLIMNIEASGAKIAEILTDSSKSQGYDVAIADAVIAKAISNLQKSYNH